MQNYTYETTFWHFSFSDKNESKPFRSAKLSKYNSTEIGRCRSLQAVMQRVSKIANEKKVTQERPIVNNMELLFRTLQCSVLGSQKHFADLIIVQTEASIADNT